MIAFVDAAVIVALVGAAVGAVLGDGGGGGGWGGGWGAGWGALAGAGVPGAVGILRALPGFWLALATPALIRSDVAHRRLPDVLTLPAVALVPVAAVGEVWGQDPAPLRSVTVLGVVVAVAGLGLLGARVGAVGLGDVKLGVAIAGASAVADPGVLPVVAGVTGLAGAVLALGVVVRRRRRRRRGRPRGALPRRDTVAYGPCLLAGFWCGQLWLAVGGAV